MSLISLAEQDNLPDNQLMDEETINWILSNKPDFLFSNFNKNYAIFAMDMVLSFSPPEDWFLRSENINSIHGLRHILRVIANISYLIKENRISNKKIITSVLIAGLLHDLRRQNDKNDNEHAERANIWFIEKQDQILKYFKNINNQIDINSISAAILLHNKDYNVFSGYPNYLKNKFVVDFLKSGDALDRYRLPKLKWWINNQYLSLIPSEEAKLFAYELVLESEKKFLEINDSKKAVLMTLTLLNNKHGRK